MRFDPTRHITAAIGSEEAHDRIDVVCTEGGSGGILHLDQMADSQAPALTLWSYALG